ncbi:MAG: hypothetical protein LBC98_06800, partial [Prevotellaceae bacterium]|nr:hypothetical protein [Prevotellaceae bacterium]
MNINFPDFPVCAWLCLSIFALSLLVQLYYYVFVYSKVARSQTSNKASNEVLDRGLSVIIY